MGTNLLNLSPSFLDKRTCRGARLRLFRLAGEHRFRLRFLFCIPGPKPSITACYSGNFRLSFRSPCGNLPGGSCQKSVRLSHLAMACFPGYSHRLSACDFHQSTPGPAPCSSLYPDLNYLKERPVSFLTPAVRCLTSPYGGIGQLRLPAICNCFLR